LSLKYFSKLAHMLSSVNSLANIRMMWSLNNKANTHGQSMSSITQPLICFSRVHCIEDITMSQHYHLFIFGLGSFKKKIEYIALTIWTILIMTWSHFYGRAYLFSLIVLELMSHKQHH
jgi:hypothetical protein